MKYHIKPVPEDRKESKCNICDYSTNLKISINRDISSVHEGNKAFQCEIYD